MKENHVPLAQRFSEFPWILSDLIFPFMVEYMVRQYVPSSKSQKKKTPIANSHFSWSGISSGRSSSISSPSSPASATAASTTRGGTAVRLPLLSKNPQANPFSLHQTPIRIVADQPRCYSIMGPIRPRLEPPRPHLPPPARLPLLHLLSQGEQAHRHPHHLLPVRVYTRAGHVVSVQEAEGLSAYSADVSTAGTSPSSYYSWLGSNANKEVIM